MFKKDLISICIPTYEMHGNGGKFLDDLLLSIEKQTYKNMEIIISDHSKDDLVFDVYSKWYDKLKITYIRNEIGRGSLSINFNVTIDHANGEYIKTMCQDDLMYSNDALDLMYKSLQDDKFWCVFGCSHFDTDPSKVYRYHKPYWDDNMATGGNGIGNPSVVMLRNSDIRFDEKLSWLVDCEFYNRIKMEKELPVFIDDMKVLVRCWEGSTTNTIATQTMRNEEREYVINKLQGN